jgi:hypothetical protein
MLLLGMSRTEAFLATCTDVLPLLHHLDNDSALKTVS